MAFSIIHQSIQTWNLELDQIQNSQDAEARESPASRIGQIAQKCFEIRNTQGAILESDVALKESFKRVEQKVNGLFLEYLNLGSISDDDFETVFIQAAGSDDVSMLASILNSKKKITISLFSEALAEAAKGNGNTLRCLLKDSGRLQKVTEKSWISVFLRASHSDGTTLRMLVDTGIEVPNQYFPDLFSRSISGDGIILKILLGTKKPIREFEFTEAFIRAARDNNVKTLDLLLKEQRLISEEVFAQAFIQAVGTVDGNTLLMLINAGVHERVSEEVFAEAFRKSCNFNGPSLAMLLDTRRQVSDEDFGIAFIIAASRNGNTLRMLLDTGREVSDRIFGLAFNAAANKDAETTLQMLLRTQRQVSDADFDRAFISACSRNGNTLDLLIERQARVPDNIFGQAFIGAAQVDGATLALLLPQLERVSDEAFGQAFQIAGERDGYTLRMLMDTQRQVSNETFTTTLLRSVHYTSENAFSHLILSERQITDIYTRDLTILFASSLGRRDLVDVILRQGAIHQSSRDSAITQAAGEHRGAIIDMLLMARVEQRAMLARRHAYTVSLPALKESPFECLRKFCSLDALPSSFSLEETPQVVDLGGVSKQVYFELMSSLIAKNVLPVRESGLICSKEEMPLATAHLVGKFFSLLDDRNIGRSDKFLTGHVFSTAFYQLARILLVSASTPEDKQRAAAALLKTIETDFAPCFAWIESPSESSKEDIEPLMVLMGGDGEAEDYARSKLEEFLAPIEAFLNGASNSFKDKIKEIDPNELRIQIQGEAITADGLCSALRMEGEDTLLKRQLEWIKEKITASDGTWQKAFLYAITGRNTMMSNTEIKIKHSWRNVFEIHTCFNTLDLPNTEMNKEDFLAALDAAILDQSYNIA